MATSRLTGKQQHFARTVSSGCTLSDAYREAYDAENMSPAAVRTEASRLMAHPDITLLVGRLQRAQDRAVVATYVSDRERVLTKLRSACDGEKTTMLELRAAELLGKSVGLFKDVQVQEKPMSTEEIEAELEEKLTAFGWIPDPDKAVH